MPSCRQQRRVRGVWVGALAGLMLASTPALAEERDSEDEPYIECDAELLDDQDFDDEEEGIGYLVEPGQPLDCRAHGLTDDVEAGWYVGWEGMFGEGELEDVGTPVEGTFEFTVPLPDMDLWFDGVVFQGEEGTEDYIELFFWGLTDLETEVLDMTCEPDPARMGETVACVVDEAPPEEPFHWAVYLLDEETHEDLHDEDDVDEDFDEPVVPIDPSITGEGTADADGVAVFEFEMPVEEGVVAYEAVADFLVAEAWFVGSVVPAPDTPEPTPAAPEPTPAAPEPTPAAPEPTPATPEPTPATPKPTPAAPDEPEPTPSPVAVEQPTRVDTGAGGAAPPSGGGVPSGLWALILVAAAGLGLGRRYIAPGGR